jgi:hypothetical protein
MKKILVVCFLGALAIYLIVEASRKIPERSPDGSVRMDIGKFEVAVADFKHAFDIPYLPSRIKLSETGDYPQRDQPDTLDHDSVEYLKRLWPAINLEPGTRIDWNGDGQIGGNWTLEGDECLVFFLGGIPTAGNTPGCLGFSANSKNPTSPGGLRHGPFFPDFMSYRLRDLHGRGFYSYLDDYGKQPYAYFSAYGKANGYNRYGSTDCLSLRVWPYAEALQPQPRFINPKGFQILSAGADRQFGPGTDSPAHVWSRTTADSIPEAGRDDLANFSHVHLGQPQKE